MPPASPRPSFGLSRWEAPGDDVFAVWQRDLDTGRLGGGRDRSAAIAGALAWERVVLGPHARRR